MVILIIALVVEQKLRGNIMKVGDIIQYENGKAIVTYIDEEGVVHLLGDTGEAGCMWYTDDELIVGNLEHELKFLLYKMQQHDNPMYKNYKYEN
jgi:hypothetical protein